MPIIVIKSRTKERITGTFSTEWSVHRARRHADGTLSLTSNLVSKRNAQKTIREYGLVSSFQTPDGEIFDTTTGSFKELFPNGLHSKADIKTIETVDRL